MVSRRALTLMGGAAALTFALGPALGQSATPARIAVFDWGLAETLLALGVTPVTLAETEGYREWVIEPALPAEVAEAGLRIEPNFEAIAAVRPDLILITPELESLRPMMQRIARTETLAIYRPDGKAWDHARETVTAMARLLGREAQGDALLRRVDGTLDAARDRVQSVAQQRPVYLVSFIDRRHVRIYGANSIFQTVLDRLGLVNAYTGWTSFWGFTPLGIEHLAANPQAQLIYLEPMPEETKRALEDGPLWNALPFVREGRVSALPTVWAFGGLTAGERLARLLSERLATGTHAAGAAGAPS